MALTSDGMDDSNISAVEKGNNVFHSDLNVSSNPTIDFIQRVCQWSQTQPM